MQFENVSTCNVTWTSDRTTLAYNLQLFQIKVRFTQLIRFNAIQIWHWHFSSFELVRYYYFFHTQYTNIELYDMKALFFSSPQKYFYDFISMIVYNIQLWLNISTINIGISLLRFGAQNSSFDGKLKFLRANIIIICFQFSEQYPFFFFFDLFFVMLCKHTE